MIVETDRLKLVAATLEMIEAEIQGLSRLCSLLNVEKPLNWPPPLNDEQSQKWFLNFVKTHPTSLGWGMWYFILKETGHGQGMLIGNGGFKGKPENGNVEIGYSILEQYQSRGFATEATGGLVGWAFKNDDVAKVIAHTMVGLRPSIRVLQKNNFIFTGNTSEPGIIRFELNKSS